MISGLVVWIVASASVGLTHYAARVVHANRSTLAFVGWGHDSFSLYTVELPGGEPVKLHAYAGTWGPPVWSPDGLQFAARVPGDIWLVHPLTWRRVNLSNQVGDEGQPVWSPDGRRIAFNALYDRQPDIYLADLSGGSSIRNLTTHPAGEGAPVWSPDGAQVAFYSDRGESTPVYVIDLTEGISRKVIDYPGVILDLAWSPPSVEREQLVFVTGRHEVIVVDVDSGESRRLTTHARRINNVAWSPDGRFLTFVETANLMMAEIYMIDVHTGENRNLTNYPGRDALPAWSPDGQWLAFVSNRGGNSARYSIYVIHAATGEIVAVTGQFSTISYVGWWP